MGVSLVDVVGKVERKDRVPFWQDVVDRVYPPRGVGAARMALPSTSNL